MDSSFCFEKWTVKSKGGFYRLAAQQRAAGREAAAVGQIDRAVTSRRTSHLKDDAVKPSPTELGVKCAAVNVDRMKGSEAAYGYGWVPGSAPAATHVSCCCTGLSSARLGFRPNAPFWPPKLFFQAMQP